MPGRGCASKGKAHTPVVSRAQQGKFGAEYGRRKAGRASQMKGITTAELRSHLRESKGRKLPARSRRRAMA